MPQEQLCYLSGQQALALFRSKALSPVELLDALISQCDRVNPHINAITDSYFEEARKKAQRSELRYLKGRPRKLDGLCVAIKDEFKVKGSRRTSSSLIYENRVDDENDIIVDRLLRAGAICHLKTTTPEFCILGSCHSRLWGITRNPFNLEITPGGSSGGSGAVLAAGMTTLATGTDIGGSIRIPAAQCGIVGYKAPYGRNPEIPVYNLDFYSHSGPMTRTVADTALMQNVISGPHNQDIASLRSRITLDTETVPGDLKGWKVAYSMNLGFMEIDESVVTNTHHALAVLKGLGAAVEEVEIGWTNELVKAVHDYWAHTWVSNFSELIRDHRDQLTDYAIWFIENSATCSAQDFNHSLQVAVNMYNHFGPMMDRYDLFVCPTLGTNQIPAAYTWPEAEVTINGNTKGCIEELWSQTYPFNMLSRCPVLSLPAGRTANNVPTGVQFVARTFDDKRVFEAAKAYEAAVPEFFQWPLDPAIP